MKELKYEVRFVTPAFLGNATQAAQWRTPPFKALLRQWWRIMKAKDVGYNHGRLREEEGKLFGHAWLEHERENDRKEKWAMRGGVRVKLNEWREGSLKQWANDPKVLHKEVGDGGKDIGGHLYLGYGPLVFKKGTNLKSPLAIKDGDSAVLSLFERYPDERIADSLQLIHWFGTIGGRSRSGWGSVFFTGEGIAPIIDANRIMKISRPLTDCLQLDWPHAFGRDEKGLLIWNTKVDFNTWSDAMKSLAAIKIDFRTSLPFQQAKPGSFEKRHVLAYPVTNHPVHKWGSQARLANQLRFKVALVDGKFRGIVYHLPCSVPQELMAKLGHSEVDFVKNNQSTIWKVVHERLDSQMVRIK